MGIEPEERHLAPSAEPGVRCEQDRLDGTG